MSSYNVVLLLGSNIGNTEQNLQNAIAKIENRIGNINKLSKTNIKFINSKDYVPDLFLKKMEEKLFDEDFRPFLGYRNDHDIRYGIPFNRFSILYAPFLVIGIPFILTLAISLVKLYNALKC